MVYHFIEGVFDIKIKITVFLVLLLFMTATLPVFAVATNLPQGVSLSHDEFARAKATSAEKEKEKLQESHSAVAPLEDIDIGYVMDTADLLSPQEEQSLLQEASQLVQDEEIAVYILTVEDYRSLSDGTPYQVATQFFEENNLGAGEERNGVLLMLSMAARDYAYIVHGKRANAIFDEDKQIDIEGEFLEEFADNDWYNGFSVFISETSFTITYGWLSTLLQFLLIVVGAFGLALISAFAVRSRLKSVKMQSGAGTYIQPGGVNMQVREDVFTHTTETRTRIKKESSGSGGGGGGGGRSFSGGGFSGRSGKF